MIFFMPDTVLTHLKNYDMFEEVSFANLCNSGIKWFENSPGRVTHTFS
jgi:hypothetical protein